MDNTIRDYLEPLMKECNRVLECMSREHPCSQNYKAMVDVLVKLDGIVDDVEYNVMSDTRREMTASLYKEAFTKKTEKKAQEPEPFPTAEPVPEPVGEPEPVTVVEEVPWVEDDKLTREDVRAICKDMAAKGVLVQPIMTKYIPEGKNVTLSNVKAADYAAFVKELRNAQ